MGKYNKEQIGGGIPSMADLMQEVEEGNHVTDGFKDMFGIKPEVETVVLVPLSEIRDFGGAYGKNRFQVRKEKVEEIAESIRISGVLVPVILRPDKSGLAKYECIAGHTRRAAAALAEQDVIPAIIRDCDDEVAQEVMAATNHQREDLLPSEKAWLYRIQYDAMKRQAGRKRNGTQVGNQNQDENGTQVGYQKKTIELLAEKSDDSKNQILRYIRLTHLCDILLGKVDEKKLAVNAAVELSYLKEKEQMRVGACITADQCKVSIEQAKELKAKFEQVKGEGQELTVDEIRKILRVGSEVSKPKLTEAKILLPGKLLSSIPGWKKKNKKYLSEYTESVLAICFEEPELMEKIKKKLAERGFECMEEEQEG